MQHRRDTVMAVGLGEEAAKALEVGRDLAGNAFEATRTTARLSYRLIQAARLSDAPTPGL